MKQVKPKSSRPVPPKIPPKSPSFEDDLVLETIVLSKVTEEPFKEIEIDASRVLEIWETSTEDFQKRLTLILGKAYGLTNALAKVQDELRTSKIDPAAEILDTELIKAIERFVSLRIQHEILDFLYDGSSDSLKSQVELILKNILEKKVPGNPLKDMLDKMVPKSSEDSPFSDPTSNIGVKVSLKDSK